MALTAKPVVDLPGFTAGEAYTVLGYTSSTVLVLNNEKKLAHISYAALEDEARWSIEADDSQAKQLAAAQADLAAARAETKAAKAEAAKKPVAVAAAPDKATDQTG